MEHAKKMVLVDPRMLENLGNHGNATVPIIQPETQVIDMTVKSLDEGLRKILDAPNMAEDEKAKLYSHYLGQYIAMKKKQTHLYRGVVQPETSPPLQDMESSKPSVSQAQAEAIRDEVIRSIPKPMRKQGELLLERISRDPEMGWNQRGELVVSGNTIPNSNMVDLVNDLLRKRKGVDPPGWKALARQLYKSNVPQDMVRNVERWNFMVGQHDSSNELTNSEVQSAIGSLERQTPRGRPKSTRSVDWDTPGGWAARQGPPSLRPSRKITSPFNPKTWVTLY